MQGCNGEGSQLPILEGAFLSKTVSTCGSAVSNMCEGYHVNEKFRQAAGEMGRGPEEHVVSYEGREVRGSTAPFYLWQ